MIKKIVKKIEKPKKSENYIEAIGRRKTAVARVRIYPDEMKNEISVNGKNLIQYFPLKKNQQTATEVFQAINGHYRTTVKVAGSGLNAQAEAIRLGIARAVVIINPAYRPILKQLGYLTRDPRMVERKHPGLRKARRAQQWRKR